MSHLKIAKAGRKQGHIAGELLSIGRAQGALAAIERGGPYWDIGQFGAVRGRAKGMEMSAREHLYRSYAENPPKAIKVNENSKAVKDFKRFHGSLPKSARIIRIDDGKPGVTRKVVVGLGRTRAIEYDTKGGFRGSNKKEANRWRHAMKGKALLIKDPETGIVSAGGGDFYADDWLRGG